MNKNEIISKIIDNESVSEQMIDTLINSVEVTDGFYSNALVHDILQDKDNTVFLSKSFTLSVCQQLESIVQEQYQEQPLPQKTNVLKFSYIRKFMTPLLQFGVAAGVFLAVIAGVSLTDTDNTAEQPTTNMIKTVPFISEVRPVSSETIFYRSHSTSDKLNTTEQEKLKKIIKDYQQQKYTTK